MRVAGIAFSLGRTPIKRIMRGMWKDRPGTIRELRNLLCCFPCRKLDRMARHFPHLPSSVWRLYRGRLVTIATTRNPPPAYHINSSGQFT